MNEEDLQELRRIIEEEQRRKEEKKERKRERTRLYNKERSQTPGARKQEIARAQVHRAANREAYNAYMLRNKHKRQEQKAGRPRPDTCEVCGNDGQVVFDHCHTSDKFRGWICTPCNLVLGLVNDDAERLEKLTAYIRSHE